MAGEFLKTESNLLGGANTSNKAKSDWSEACFFLALFFLLLSIGRTRLLHDSDTFWHIVVGREILESGRMMHADIFSFIRLGEPWIANQWLSECLMELIDRLAGFDGLVIATATLLAGLYAWVGGRLVSIGLNWLVVVLI